MATKTGNSDVNSSPPPHHLQSMQTKTETRVDRQARPVLALKGVADPKGIQSAPCPLPTISSQTCPAEDLPLTWLALILGGPSHCTSWEGGEALPMSQTKLGANRAREREGPLLYRRLNLPTWQALALPAYKAPDLHTAHGLA